jgi:hypothetical protein
VLSRSKGGVWIIERGVLTTDRRGTPRTTVRAFVHALEAKDFARLREFAPLELRQEMTVQQLREQIESDSRGTSNLLQRLRPYLDAPIIVKGAYASMSYAGALFEMRFEEGRWVVLDPD